MSPRKRFLTYLPYLLMGLYATNFGEAWRMAVGEDASAKLLSLISVFPAALKSFWPSLHPFDLLVGLCCGAGLWLAVYLKRKRARKYRHGMEYGSARWGTHDDIAPYMDPVFWNNVILTQTERLTMSSRPKDPKTARNKNVLVIGGSGSGKTRFWLKPNLMQMHSSYVVTDPKGTILVECGRLLQRGAPKRDKHGKPLRDAQGKMIYEPYRIKVLNTINFSKSMHYNPFAYIHSEKDILKLVNCLISNTKGEGQGGDPFWIKAETLLYSALISYIHDFVCEEEQNFTTLIEMIDSMQTREDNEDYQNVVDLLFEQMEKEHPGHFAVRQYKKFKLAAGGGRRWPGCGWAHGNPTRAARTACLRNSFSRKRRGSGNSPDCRYAPRDDPRLCRGFAARQRNQRSAPGMPPGLPAFLLRLRKQRRTLRLYLLPQARRMLPALPSPEAGMPGTAQRCCWRSGGWAWPPLLLRREYA